MAINHHSILSAGISHIMIEFIPSLELQIERQPVIDEGEVFMAIESTFPFWDAPLLAMERHLFRHQIKRIRQYP